MKTIFTLVLFLSITSLYAQDYEKLLVSGYWADAITHDNKNGTLVAGVTSINMYVVQLSDSGEVVWQKEYDLDINGNYVSIREVYKIVPTSDSCFLITARVYNSMNDTFNVVYRRDDGNIGWIDPSIAK